jgi:hypothetical protein
MDKLMGYGIKRVQGNWCVIEIRSNSIGAGNKYTSRKSFVHPGSAADEAKEQAVATHTKYFYELK